MINFLNHTFEVDTFTIVVVALLSGWSGILTVQVLSRTMLAMLAIATHSNRSPSRRPKLSSTRPKRKAKGCDKFLCPQNESNPDGATAAR